jgi:hypothetical protein
LHEQNRALLSEQEILKEMFNMKNFRRFLTFSAFVAIAGATAVQAAPTVGDYKMTTGSEPACALTLAADGTATVGACTRLATAGRWHTAGSGFELDDHAGTLLATFRATSDGYAGKAADGSRSYQVTPASQTAAAH